MPDNGTTPGVGHNSGQTEKSASALRLKSFIERIERLEEEQKALAGDKREVYAELKGAGYDPKIVRKVIARRKLDAADLAEQEALMDVYLDAIGDLKGTPLGEAGVKSVGKKQPQFVVSP